MLVGGDESLPVRVFRHRPAAVPLPARRRRALPASAVRGRCATGSTWSIDCRPCPGRTCARRAPPSPPPSCGRGCRPRGAGKSRRQGRLNGRLDGRDARDGLSACRHERPRTCWRGRWPVPAERAGGVHGSCGWPARLPIWRGETGLDAGIWQRPCNFACTTRCQAVKSGVRRRGLCVTFLGFAGRLARGFSPGVRDRIRCDRPVTQFSSPTEIRASSGG